MVIVVLRGSTAPTAIVIVGIAKTVPVGAVDQIGAIATTIAATAAAMIVVVGRIVIAIVIVAKKLAVSIMTMLLIGPMNVVRFI